MNNKNNLIKVRKQFQADLLTWYDKEARVLPWRSEPTPYRVWISEMMLQQTRVDTVIPYFMRFLTELPTIKDLAEVEEDRLLKLWQGLGYYNRALNLKKAAQIVVDQFQGQLPSEKKDLVSLPGIGPYSAGAISSIAFGKAVPAVDGNVLRILSRILASMEDIANSKIKKELEEVVTELIPEERPGDFNQALMDLGATICLPNGEPKCIECPVKEHCKAHEEGLTSEIPIKTVKKARAIDKKTVFVIFSGQQFALRKRGESGLLANLWELPNVEGHLTEEQSKQVLLGMGIEVKQIQPIKQSKHTFSHREWHMKGYLVEAEEPNLSNLIWVTEEEIKQQYSIPTAFKDFMKFCHHE